MSIERISTIQTASVITQPTDAVVERPWRELTLIEKLEKQRDAWFKRHKEYCDMEARSRGCAIDECIDIVKQHQAESGWKHVKEKPTQRGRYLVCATDGKMFDCRYSQDYWHKNNIGYRDILYWMPLPQPPSEVQA